MAVRGWLESYSSKMRYVGEEGEEDLSFFLAAGPLSILCTLALALQHKANFDLVFIGGLGIVLCSAFRRKGMVYALLLLLLGVVCKHTFFLDRHHLWQFGVETSMAMGLLLHGFGTEMLAAQEECFAQRFDTLRHSLHSLQQQTEGRCEKLLEEKRVLEIETGHLKKQIEQIFSREASLQILNEVLRQSAVKKEIPAQEIEKRERRIAELLAELDRLQSALQSRQDGDLPWKENARLLQELNRARVDKEQTRLINETLVRMHASAARKVEQQQTNLQELSGQVRTYEERIRSLTEIQALYLQLKQQFGEKKQVLRKTRQELFRAETAWQAAKMDRHAEEMEFPFFESLLVREVHFLEGEKKSLESENAELSELIGILSKPRASSRPRSRTR